MGSPFPGMDPYLERHWRDVHQELAALARRNLNQVLPGDLVARLEERLIVDSIDYERPRTIYPDVGVFNDPGRAAKTAGGGGGSVVAEPVILEFDQEDHVEPFITITDRDGGQVITAIEFISPSNKLPGPGRDQYRMKRTELQAAHVSVVEIDLTRQGSWRELLSPVVAPWRVETAYRAIIWRISGQVALYPMGLRNRLPAIPIPLRATDQDVILELQPLLDEVYVNGRYAGTNYNKACEPALEGEDGEWAMGRVKATKAG